MSFFKFNLVFIIIFFSVFISCGSSKVNKNILNDSDDMDMVDEDAGEDDGSVTDTDGKDDGDPVDSDNESFCGNDIVEGSEVCDGNVVDCVEINPNRYKAGKARCKNDCSGFDTVTCEENDEFCGDGTVNLDEVCDGDALFCAHIDPALYTDGIAECNSDCSGYDVSTCTEIETVCGDGKIEGKEVCEKGDLEDCVKIDASLYKGGKAYCLNDCSGWDTITCEEITGAIFSDNFENGDAKWILSGDWEVGEPFFDSGNMSVITAAFSGNNVLATNLTGIYSKSKVMDATVSESLEFPVSAKITLEFMAYVWTDYEGAPGAVTKWYDGLMILYSENGNSLVELSVESNNPDLIGSFESYNTTTSSYTTKTGVRGHSIADTYSKFTVDMTVLSGKTVDITLRFISDMIDRPTDIGIYIDDVVIKAD